MKERISAADNINFDFALDSWIANYARRRRE